MTYENDVKLHFKKNLRLHVHVLYVSICFHTFNRKLNPTEFYVSIVTGLLILEYIKSE